MRSSRRRERFRPEALPVALAACLLAGCRSTPAAAPAAVSADTWAVVDGRPITRAEVDKAFRRTRDPAQRLSDEETLTLRLNLLNELIVEDILRARAAALKLEVPESELEAAYGNARQNMTDDAFRLELLRRGLTEADMRDGLRRQLLVQKVIDHEIGSKLSVTDQEIAAFFEANRAQFNVPEDAYHLAQIVVTPVRDPQLANRTGDDAATPEQAAAKVRMLLERLKAGASFQDLAASYSEDPESAPRGGDLGFVPVSRLKQAPPPLRDAVLDKAPGSVNVVSAGGAYTLVLVLARERAGQRDLSSPEVRDRIKQTLRDRKEQLFRTAYLASAQSEAKVVNYLARRVVESPGSLPALLSGPAR